MLTAQGGPSRIYRHRQSHGVLSRLLFCLAFHLFEHRVTAYSTVLRRNLSSRYRLPPYLCYNAYHFVNTLPLCLCVKVELLIAPMVMIGALQVLRTSDIL